MGSGILGTNLLAGHGFFGFDPTPNASLTGTVKNMTAGNFTTAGDTNAPTTNTAQSTAPQQTSSGGNVQGAYTGSGAYAGTPGGTGGTSAADQAYIQDQIASLNSLLGRTDTNLNQGLTQLNDSYQSGVNQRTGEHAQALQDYTDQRTATNKDKLSAYDTANKNANNGYRSLAQIIGRGSGTGSSAFQEALPDMVGKDLSANRTAANDVYASNLGNIDTAQKKTDQSFESILADLAQQRQSQEGQLRTGIENQRQSLLGEQQQLQAQAGNAAGARALQPQIEQSRNAVESFFNQFKPGVTAQQATIAAPDLAGYQVDRANVNAQQQGAADPSNPYAEILRRKLQENPTA